jgi:hypothetical protein
MLGYIIERSADLHQHEMHGLGFLKKTKRAIPGSRMLFRTFAMYCGLKGFNTLRFYMNKNVNNKGFYGGAIARG